MLESKNITINQENKKTKIIENVSIKAEKWLIKSIIGPSWAGKSSILWCLSGFTQPHHWEVSLNWKNILSYNKNELYPKIWLVTQSLFLRPHLTIQENITIAQSNTKKENNIDTNTLINKFNIRHILDKYPLECSWWERQRATLVRHLSLNSEYLLLDEITSALDIEHIQIIAKELEEMKTKTAIILVTHMIHFAKNISDEIYFIDSGKVTEHWGKEIIDKPKTKRLERFLNIL